MTKLPFKTNAEIEDLRGHDAETVNDLRRVLADGARAHADPHRNNFYEVENGTVVYYIHVSPATGKIHLLATWPKEPLAATA
jgi:hypothetical protein